jgi:hypothetical protein
MPSYQSGNSCGRGGATLRKNEAASYEGEDGLACKGAPFGSAKYYCEFHREPG